MKNIKLEKNNTKGLLKARFFPLCTTLGERIYIARQIILNKVLKCDAFMTCGGRVLFPRQR